MHFVGATVDDKGFLAVDGVPRQGAVGEPDPCSLLHYRYHFNGFDDGETEWVRRYDYTGAGRHRTCGVHCKSTRGLNLPVEHPVSCALPKSVATTEEHPYF